MPAPPDRELRLLPRPKRVSPLAGRCPTSHGFALDPDPDDPRLNRAAAPLTTANAPVGEATRLRLSVDRSRAPRAHPQGYRLTIRPTGVDAIGGSPAGCAYALATLRQLIALSGDSIPCCDIEDWPDFETRGLLIDVSRGRTPTVRTLEAHIDRLAGWKINQVQLYIEHAFVFNFDPEIAGPDEALTPDEVRRLDAYARDRFIDLVPAVATLGHMGRILSMPRYRHLAEIEADDPWTQWPWPKRARGLTLDCINPDGAALAQRMWGDILAAFSSPVVNICGDEPWDLGRGKNRNRLSEPTRPRVGHPGRGDQPRGSGHGANPDPSSEPTRPRVGQSECDHEPWSFERGKNRNRLSEPTRPRVGQSSSIGEAYADYIRGLQDFCAEHGRQTQMWGDIIRNYPDHWHVLDPKTIVLHWGYDDAADYGATRRFTDAGFKTFVCPGTSAWKRILPAVGLAERNIDTFARTGRAGGAVGLLNTDWGDHGHLAPPGASLHGIALGAAKAWSADHPIGEAFDRCFARLVWGTDDPGGTSLLRTATAIAERCETWRTFWMDDHEVRTDPTLPDVEALRASQDAAESLAAWCGRVQGESADCAAPIRAAGASPWSLRAIGARTPSSKALEEVELAASLHAIACQRLLWIRQGAEPHTPDWSDRLNDLADRYAGQWLAGHKPLRLDDVLRALRERARA